MMPDTVTSLVFVELINPEDFYLHTKNSRGTAVTGVFAIIKTN